MSLQDECNSILDNEQIFEEDKIDQLEDLVRQRFPNLGIKEVEKKIMDILWKHKDPSRQEAKIVKVEQREMEIDFEEIEKKIELERQSNKLSNISDVDREYNDVVEKIENLNVQIYGCKKKSLQRVEASPIDKISEIFNGSVPKQRIEQSLRVSGYSVVEACKLLVSQLKKDRATRAAGPIKPLFSLEENIVKTKLCSYLIRNGECLRSDCPFSHDLEQRVCHFWLKGHCIAGDKCTFKHSIDGLDTLPGTGILQAKTSVGLPSASSTEPTTASSTDAGEKPKYKFSSLPSFTPSSAINIQTRLKKPALIPWEEQPHLVFKKYLELRNSAMRNESQRKKYALQSTQEWKKNNGEKSKKLSDKANNFEDKMMDDLKRADDELYEYSKTTRDESWFEMHGLEYNDAIEQLASNLQAARDKNNVRELVYLVVPGTSDYQGFKKITKPIQIWLDQEGYRWEIYNYNSQYGSIMVVDANF